MRKTIKRIIGGVVIALILAAVTSKIGCLKGNDQSQTIAKLQQQIEELKKAQATAPAAHTAPATTAPSPDSQIISNIAKNGGGFIAIGKDAIESEKKLKAKEQENDRQVEIMVTTAKMQQEAAEEKNRLEEQAKIKEAKRQEELINSIPELKKRIRGWENELALCKEAAKFDFMDASRNIIRKAEIDSKQETLDKLKADLEKAVAETKKFSGKP